MIWLLLILASFIAIICVYYFLKGAGCSGDCQQGRKECNCKGKE